MAKKTQIPIRDAATIVLLRDGAPGLETLLLQRHGDTVFGPGHYVFPGGAVDAADADPALQARCDGLDDAQASRVLGIRQGGLAFWIAVVRECFEESGLLLATDEAGRVLSAEQDFAAERQALNAGSLDFAGFCQQAGLRLPMRELVYYTHWTTPPGAPRRFNTHFFACAATSLHAMASHDGVEIVGSGWHTPQQALAAFDAGRYPMMPPTVTQLRFLSMHDNCDAALAALSALPVAERGPDLNEASSE